MVMETLFRHAVHVLDRVQAELEKRDGLTPHEIGDTLKENADLRRERHANVHDPADLTSEVVSE